MAVSNGKFTMSDTNKETTSALFEQIGGLIGVGARSDGKIHLSDLCVGSGVNKWAKYKPIQSTTVVNISESERAQQFYGFDIQAIFCNDSEDTLETALSNGADYPYIKPSSWFRLRDFNGYNSKAEIPFKYTQYTDPKTNLQWVEVYLNPMGEIRLSEILPTEIGADVANFKIALVYRKRGTDLLNEAFAVDDNDNYVTVSDVENGAQPIIRFTLPDGGTYDMVLAITDATYSGQADTNWLYLPSALFVATYDPSVTSFNIAYNEDSALVGVTSTGSTIVSTSVRVEGVHLDMRLDGGDEALEGNLIIQFSSEYSGSGTWEEEIEYKKEFVLEKNASVYFYEGRLAYYFTEPYIDKIYVKARIEYRSKWSIDSYATRYIDLTTDAGDEYLALSDEEFAPVTLKDIAYSRNW